MRYLFILRGLPASGKSTWIQENHLEPYTISSDNLRLLVQSPILLTDGKITVPQGNDTYVWKILFELVERHMKNGELVIVDATHAKASMLSKYKNLMDQYRYRGYVVNFDVPLNEVLERNRLREDYKFVPEDIIKSMSESLKTKASSSFKVMTPDEASKFLKEPLKPVEIPETVEKVVVFGDIHGCYAPLKQYFEQNPFSDKNIYVFTGDYLDRGIQNKEVLQFLLAIYEKENVFLLEGNHERWLRKYSAKSSEKSEYGTGNLTAVLTKKKAELEKRLSANKLSLERLEAMEDDEVYFEFELINREQKILELEKENCSLEMDIVPLENYLEYITQDKLDECKEWYIKKYGDDFDTMSEEFTQNTIPQIVDIPKEEIRKLCRKLIQLSYFDVKGSRFVVTHGGLPCLPNIFTHTNQMIKGVGNYENHALVDEQFEKNTPYWAYQIHGHRNTLKSPIKTGRTFNLESEVEFGGYLRIVEIEQTDHGYKIRPIEIKNDVYRKPIVQSDKDILKNMYHSDLIMVKDLEDNIVSFNFNKDAFFSKKWNDLTCTARGLFVDKTNGNIVARSFSKFFHLGEHRETELSALEKNMVFPAYAYKKENGFLGIVSKYNGKVRYFSKSSDSSKFAHLFIGGLCDNFGLNSNGAAYNQLMREITILDEQLKEPFLTDKEEESIVDAITELETRRFDILDALTEKFKDIQEGYSYVFECVDQENDPHIIKYDTNKVFLLECFKNQLTEEHVPYEELLKIGKQLGFEVKELTRVFLNWEEFKTWIEEFPKLDCKHEGYVIEDSNNFRVKFKSVFYSSWKELRGIKDRIIAGKELNKAKGKQAKVIDFMKSLGVERLKIMSIIDIREAYEDQETRIEN